ncbi:MAG: glycine cleavage system aminomethyltransferase GcvT [bacterium]|nr:glycine cleavage system aminomethyltransferase GcvT [bacterium]
MPELKRTSLYETHKRLGARLVEFGGFEMPVQYSSILKEHAAVREKAGLFDVSHMGQIEIRGARALEAVERLLSCRVDSLAQGRVRYGLLCNEDGGVVDDVTLYRKGSDDFMLCVNASNIQQDDAWIRARVPSDVEVVNASAATGMLALQGPASTGIVEALTGTGPSRLERFQFDHFDLLGHDALISSTGYTGAPGYELYLPDRACVATFEALLDAGAPHGLLPAGLGARDTLRLEAALPLYGHELDPTTSPLEAGLGRFVKRKRGGFIGAEAIEERAAAPQTRVLAGFEMVGRGIARAGSRILREGEAIGVVTSGAPSPTLGKPIGLGYVTPTACRVGSRVDIEIRGKAVEGVVAKTPFVVKVDQSSAR